MEPVSLVLAGGALAVFYADYVSRRDEDQRSILPPTLPEMMGEKTVDDTSSVLVIAVNVQRIRVTNSHMAGQKLKVRVKYGEAGHSIHSDTCVEKAAWPEATHYVAHVSHGRPANEQPVANYGMTCLFLGSDQLKSVIRLRLIREGGTPFKMESVVAKAQLHLPRPDSGMEKTEILLEREKSIFDCTRTIVGTLEVGVEVQAVTKSQLREYLQVLDAQTQKEAFLVGTTPVIEGHVESTRENLVRETPVAQGQALPAHFCLPPTAEQPHQEPVQ
eukprot:TRINITY_DN25393_c0_g2_i1.p1 TRINITY_DN25393_c0_g2~~TRINITY_DN25393_c0_g2_i1.p1  ORF type:complete len:274 (+),score=43.02 TRINITY_DN25393_c0_g2_i1:92-913(+)